MNLSKNIMSVRTPVIWLTMLYVVTLTRSAPEEDRVLHMPGQPPGVVKFRHYAGYLDIGDGMRLFYWFLESQSDPVNDPVTLVEAGGFVCSAGNTVLSFTGPWKIGYNLTLMAANYSWNTMMNALYIDISPLAGYSYYTTNNSQVLTDHAIANFTQRALNEFFVKFPEYKKNPFYMTGESRGFVYATMLSLLLVDDPSINFKGLYVISGVGMNTLSISLRVAYMYYHGFMGTNAWRKFIRDCCKSPDLLLCEIDYKPTQECQKQIDGLFDGLPMEYIYGKCNVAGKKKPGMAACREVFDDLTARINPYMTQESVRKALHVYPQGEDWVRCKDSNLQFTEPDNLFEVVLNLTKKKKVPTATLR